MKPAPKKCPICGRAPRVEAPNAEWSANWRWAVECDRQRGLTLHRVYVEGFTEAEAVARWNRLVGKRRAKK